MTETATTRSEPVLVAMSGGVDSAVAAALLQEQGFEVIGVTLRLGADPSTSCCDLGSLDSARAAAAKLGIEHQVWSAAERFEEVVLRPTWQEYARGRTPNPCIQCNEALKFWMLAQEAERRSVRWLATGHYARLEPAERGDAVAEAAPRLLRGVDPAKDQSYFLYRLTADQLARCRFPLGGLTKQEVRGHAERLDLPCADRPESQDACLVSAEGSFAEALRQRFEAPSRPGVIQDRLGRPRGRHPGVHRFTLGQRRGTGVATGSRSYVSAIDASRATVTLSADPQDLMSGGLEVRSPHWLPGVQPLALQGGEFRYSVQIRYRTPAVPATVAVSPEGVLRVRFTRPQRAVTPGQAAVIYLGDRVLGGGAIDDLLDAAA